MRNYRDSDYALNKFSDGIVYRFADGVVKVTLEGYLMGNPDKTADDFRALKELSDAIYLEQVRDENAQTKKNVPIHGMEHHADFGDVPLDEAYIDKLDKQAAVKAFDALLENGELTDAQKRRFLLHYFEDKSYRVIADCEGVTVRAIQKSIYTTTDKLKKYFAFFKF